MGLLLLGSEKSISFDYKVIQFYAASTGCFGIEEQMANTATNKNDKYIGKNNTLTARKGKKEGKLDFTSRAYFIRSGMGTDFQICDKNPLFSVYLPLLYAK